MVPRASDKVTHFSERALYCSDRAWLSGTPLQKDEPHSENPPSGVVVIMKFAEWTVLMVAEPGCSKERRVYLLPNPVCGR